jgi:hypothetical protein
MFSIKSEKVTEDDFSRNHHATKIEELKNDICSVRFMIESNRKYHKIIFVDNGYRSCHAFVDKKTGGVFKSASWKSPAKGERFNLLLIKDREWLPENATWSGGYLYKR